MNVNCLLLTALVMSVTVICLVEFSSSDGQLSLKLLNYTNPSKCLENGACCDSGCQDCDNYFILCLSDPQLDPGCNLGYLWMDEAGNDNFVFTNLIADVDLNDVENPMIYNFPKWNGSVSITLDVWDADGGNVRIDHASNQFVGRLTYHLNATPFWNATEATTHFQFLTGSSRCSNSGPKLAIEVKVYCKPKYMPPSCSEYCTDKDGASGHYRCNYLTGTKDCLPGWYGSKCLTPCLPRNDSLGHYTCNNTNGDKLCLKGWRDPKSNCTLSTNIQDLSIVPSLSMQTPEFTDSKYTSTLPVTQGKLTVTSLLYFITTQSLISTTTSTMTSATTPHITQILSPSQKQTYSYYNQPILSTTSTQISVRSSYSFILSTDSSGLHLTSSPAVMTSIMPSSKISEYSNTTKAKHNLEVHLSGNTSKNNVTMAV